jgi:hypothetical protein
VPTLHETLAIVKHEFDPFSAFCNMVVYLGERGTPGRRRAQRRGNGRDGLELDSGGREAMHLAKLLAGAGTLTPEHPDAPAPRGRASRR